MPASESQLREKQCLSISSMSWQQWANVPICRERLVGSLGGEMGLLWCCQYAVRNHAVTKKGEKKYIYTPQYMLNVIFSVMT